MASKDRGGDIDRLEEQADQVFKRFEESHIDETRLPHEIKEILKRLESSPRDGIVELEEKIQEIDSQTEEESRIRSEQLLEQIKSDFKKETSEEKVISGEEVDTPLEKPDVSKERSEDAHFTVRISDDKSKATIDFYPPKGRGLSLTLDKVLKGLREEGVRYGIKREVITEALKLLSGGDTRKNVLVAEGKPKKDGVDGRIEFKFLEGESSEWV